MNKTKKDKFWQEAFEKYNILEKIAENGNFEISALQIKELGQEPRLMTKFDNSIQLPNEFKNNNLSILPITRGSYIIGPYKTFFEFEQNTQDIDIQYINFPDDIISLSPSQISSEMNAINCAYVSGILEDFIEDENLKPTVNGRMSSGKFKFDIRNTSTKAFNSINICNSQIEIDGGFEGIETLNLIEAKNNIAEDFIIRQLYYPYRKWQDCIPKKVNTIYLIYTNNIFHLYNYEFQDTNNYNSLLLKKYKKYTFEKLDISISDIQNKLETANIIKEPTIPFPQADKFERIINLMELLNEKELTKEDITTNYAFDKRQTDYYINAGKYLDLFKETNSLINLTDEGSRLLNLPYRNKQLKLVELILRHKVFNDCLKQTLNTGKLIDKDDVIKIMKLCNLRNINSNETYNRRSSTIISWLNWILNLIT